MFGVIDLTSDQALYAQVKNQVLFAIASGRLQPGEMIPTVDAMAKSTGVKPNTVAKAYRDLEVMGLVWPRRGVGFVILEGAPAICERRVLPAIAARIFGRVAEARAAGLTPEDIEAIVRVSIATDALPYAPMPPALEEATRALRSRPNA